MNRFLKKLGIHKMDEMQQQIAFKAQRNAYLFQMIALIIWTFYESYKVYTYHTRINLLPCALLTTGVIIQTLSQLILLRNAVKDDEDSNETMQLFQIIILSCAIVCVIAAIGSAIFLLSVRI